jgi:hypothetical protein
MICIPTMSSYRLHFTSESAVGGNGTSEFKFRVSIPELEANKDYLIMIEQMSFTSTPTRTMLVVCPELPVGNSVYTSVVNGSAPVLGVVRLTDNRWVPSGDNAGLRLSSVELLKNCTLTIRLLELSGALTQSTSAASWSMTLLLWPAKTRK